MIKEEYNLKTYILIELENTIRYYLNYLESKGILFSLSDFLRPRVQSLKQDYNRLYFEMKKIVLFSATPFMFI